MQTILKAQPVVEAMTKNLKSRCELLKQQGCNPQLTIFTNKDDEASKVYVRNKVKRCEEVGIQVNLLTVDKLHINSDYFLNSHPFIIQQPCSLSKDELSDVLNAHVKNDVDGFSSVNLGKILTGEQPYFYPCTPKGILKLLRYYNIHPYGKFITIVGRSNIVGKPLMAMLENENATVALCHSRTDAYNLQTMLYQSDIIISAVGDSGLYDDILDFRTIQQPYTLIDVGINRNFEGKVCGDFTRYQTEYAHAYTPVPGGVGPMTVISLCDNVIEYYEDKVWIS